MDQFRDGLGDAWATVATFIPKFIAFLAILIVGYFIAKAVEKIVDKLLERVGFDRVVERGGVKQALAKSKMDASSILAKVVFFAMFLFVLQMAFGIWGPNPVSELIQGVIAYLPNVFVAILIVVVAAAIAAGVKEIVEASLGGLSYGKGLAVGASVAIMVLGVFAALDQLQIAPTIVNTLFTGLVVLIVGSGIVAIGGGGIKTMQKYWEQAANKVEEESSNIRDEAQGGTDRVKERAEQRSQQLQGASVGGGKGGTAPSAGLGSTQPVREYGAGNERQ